VLPHDTTVGTVSNQDIPNDADEGMNLQVIDDDTLQI